MNIDFHTHGKLAKKLPFHKEYTVALFQQAKLANLNAICLTEHFNTLGFSDIYQFMKENYRMEGDTYLVEGIRIFPGMEIDILEGGHILALGTTDKILAMNEELEVNKEKGHFLPFEELIKMAEAFEIILGGAHAFRGGSNIPLLSRELLRKLFFLDLNGKDYAKRGEIARREILALAKECQIPILGGSDTHQSIQYGCLYNSFQKECTTLKELKEEILGGRYNIVIANQISNQVSAAEYLKAALKEIHRLGGDYGFFYGKANSN